MTNLFSVTAPLVIRCLDGARLLMIEKFPHPQGLLFFEPFWHQRDITQTVHLLHGRITGVGPWKIGECVISVVGCHGTDAEMAMQLAEWQEYLQDNAGDYPNPDEVSYLARKLGAVINQTEIS